MKKGKVFGRAQVIAFLMILCLGGAVWLNMKFSSTEKYMGEASFVSKNKSKAVETSAKASEENTDYFSQAKSEREKTILNIEESVKETLKSDKLTEDDKKSAVEKVKLIADRYEKANNIETLLKAKGFKKAVALINDGGIDIIVKADGLTSAQTLQIQDVVTAESGINLANIKIVTVK